MASSLFPGSCVVAAVRFHVTVPSDSASGSASPGIGPGRDARLFRITSRMVEICGSQGRNGHPKSCRNRFGAFLRNSPVSPGPQPVSAYHLCFGGSINGRSSNQCSFILSCARGVNAPGYFIMQESDLNWGWSSCGDDSPRNSSARKRPCSFGLSR